MKTLTIQQYSILYSCARFIRSRELTESDIKFVKNTMKYDEQPKHVKDILELLITPTKTGIRDKKQKLKVIVEFDKGIEHLKNPPHWYVDGTALGCNCDKCVSIRGRVDKHGRRIDAKTD